MNTLNEDEIDTILDLIVIVIFASFLLGSMVIMTQHMAKRVSIYTPTDKVVISSEEHERDDPMWFTGYQAYMFAWHMDEMSYEDLYWLGGTVGNTTVKTDGTDTKHVKIGVLDDTGNLRSQFYVWRNQMITGVGNGAERSVKKTLDSIAPSSRLADLYRGTYSVADGPVKFHLELTGDYTIKDDLDENGIDPNAGGKKFKWILIPRIKN